MKYLDCHISLVRDEKLKMPTSNLPFSTEAEVSALKNLTIDGIKTLNDAKVIFNGTITDPQMNLINRIKTIEKHVTSGHCWVKVPRSPSKDWQPKHWNNGTTYLILYDSNFEPSEGWPKSRRLIKIVLTGTGKT